MASKKVTRSVGSVPPRQTTVDRAYQREIKPLVPKMVAAWDDHKAGFITVSKRDDGTLVVLDGQQRREARMRIDQGKKPLDAVIFTNLPEEEEAALFLGLNYGVPLNQFDLYKARVLAARGNNPSPESLNALGVYNLLQGYGLVVKAGPGPNNVPAAGTLQELHRKDPKALDKGIWVLRTAWPKLKSYNTIQAWLLKAVIELSRAPGYDPKHMAKRLSKTTPDDILRVVPRTSSVPKTYQVVPYLREDVYNKRLSADKRI